VGDLGDIIYYGHYIYYIITDIIYSPLESA